MNVNINQHNDDQQELYRLFQTWHQTIGYRNKRRFLEAHLILIGPTLDLLVAVEEVHQDESLEMLQQIRQRGGSREAIREIFVDWYGGFALDLPSWLEEVEDQYHDLTFIQAPLRTLDARIALLQEAIRRGEEDENVAPETLADLFNKLAIALKQHPLLDHARTIEITLALHEAALTVFQFERYPRQWAIHQVNLGNAYAYRVEGEKKLNLEKAIEHFTAALQVYTPRRFPQQYATTLTNLGTAYQDRVEGLPDENIEKSLHYLLAALRIRTYKNSPASHAASLDKLGSAYHQRVLGDQRLNQEKAICCYKAALRIYEGKYRLTEQAMVFNNLGLLYRDRLHGSPNENQELALLYFQKALEIYTPESFPLEWALTQLNLGILYTYRRSGTKRDNLEDALLCQRRTLDILHQQSPLDYAEALNSLGNTYKLRIMGERRKNLEEAVGCFTRALQICTKETLPIKYAATQNNLAGAYWWLSRLPGKRSDYIEEAIRAGTEALQVYTFRAFPHDYAMTQGNLGVAYYSRLKGDREWNQEKAIQCFQEALQVYETTRHPLEYASMQDNLGLVYWQRVKGERRVNLALALACHMNALAIYTLKDFPLEYRNTHLNIASLAFEEMVSDAQKADDHQQLCDACMLAQKHYALARQVQGTLGWLESDEQGRASLQGFYFATREMYTREAWCLWKLGQLREAVRVLETGRAQALHEAQLLAVEYHGSICSQHLAEFDVARQNFQRARQENERVQKRVARDELLRVREKIQKHCQPDFLADTVEYQEISGAAAEDQLLIYVVAAPYGGFGLLIPPARKHPDGPERAPISLSLPRLTWEVVDEWIVTHAPQGGVIGGYQFALRRQGLELLLIWLLADDEEQYERKVATPLNQLLELLPAEVTPLKLAIEDTLVALGGLGENLLTEKYGSQQQLLALPLDHWLSDKILRKQLQAHLAWNFQKREIASLLDKLSFAVMEPVRAYLDQLGLTDREQRLAFIPCGRLGIFPCHAASVGVKKQPFGETCEMTYQASARILQWVRALASELKQPGAMLAVGDPQHGGRSTLPCAGAEAEAIVRMARRVRLAENVCLSGPAATRANFLKKLQKMRQMGGAWLHLASHGRASTNDPEESYMELSGFDARGNKARLTLATLQSNRLLLGIWGVTASGCVTGLNDLEIAPDELGSFAAGLLQAGAVCVVSTLWSVKDHATALLMVRFHSLRFQTPALSASAALREAVHWLRTASRSQIDEFARAWRLPELSELDPLRDPQRGTVSDEPAEGPQAGAEQFFASPTDQFPTQFSPFPYEHPVYWASPIIYGV